MPSVTTLPNQTAQTASSLQQQLAPCVIAMQQASGLTEAQAKTCVYYAVATHRMERYDKFPQLVLQGSQGTGKTSAKDQLAPMVYRPKSINGKTEATIRDELAQATTALIDERETVSVLEDLLTQRYARETAEVVVNQQVSEGGYVPVKRNMFGATIVCKRHPFSDGAMRSRAIVIRTKRKPGNYRKVEVPSMAHIASQLNIGGV